jgi:hypothetical protein
MRKFKREIELNIDNIVEADYVYMTGNKITLEFKNKKGQSKSYYFESNPQNMALVNKVYGKITTKKH